MIPNRLFSAGGWAMRQRRLYSAAVQVSESKVSEGNDIPRLYRRLSALGITKGSVSQTLDQYVMEKNGAGKHQLRTCVRELRKYLQFQTALEVMEWMELKQMKYSFPDYALRLDLIAKVKGLAEAEGYFSGLPSYAKNHSIYGALLNCYSRLRMPIKALDLFEEMKGLNYLSTLAFNDLMAMYMRMSQPERVPQLVHEMKERKIPLDSFTYNIWMSSYGSMGDIAEVERVFDQMTKEAKGLVNWMTFSNLAVIYAKAEDFEKSELALQKLEKRMKRRNREGYHFLISLYAKIGNMNEVHRVWNSLKDAIPVTNISTLMMLQALRSLKDVEGLTKCFNDWLSTCSSYDIRLANVAMSAYLSHDMLEEALRVFEDAVRRKDVRLLKARELFMVFYLKKRQLNHVCSQLQAAISESKNHDWHLSSETSDAIIKFFKEDGVGDADELFNILKSSNCMDSESYHLLFET